MKIGVLEWLCGGGLCAPDFSGDSPLLEEGWAMLHALARGLAASGHEVYLSLDERLAEQVAYEGAEVDWSIHWVQPSTGHEELISQWKAIACRCDWALVIAPESDGLLTRAIESLSAAGARLINCSADFLENAACKWRLAQQLESQDIFHPPACPSQQVTQKWLDNVQQRLGNQRWVLKPADGAGCDSLQVVQHPEEFIPTSDSANIPGTLLQPWIEGSAWSVSAIVDASGQWHWMPLVTQEFRGGSHPKYAGGQIAGPAWQRKHPHAMLRQLEGALGAGARGWVGVDLVYRESHDDWAVIEVNPRCTTSLVGLVESYTGNLVAELVASQHASFAGLLPEWNPAQFQASGF